MATLKPLNRKAYGSIPHLPDSRLGSGDHFCSQGQARIATEKVRDRHDFVVVTEKLDGSNVAIAKVNGIIYPLVRAGYVADTSPYRQHQMFAAWVYKRQDLWLSIIEEGSWLSGEWLAMAHGTRYDLVNAEFPCPFVPFDLWRGGERVLWREFRAWCDASIVSEGIRDAMPLHAGYQACSIEMAMANQRAKWHGAIDPLEGAVWRVERSEKVDFLCKYVRRDKVDGRYLSSVTGNSDVWNWGA